MSRPKKTTINMHDVLTYSSNISPSGPFFDRAAFYSCVQPLLPRGFRRGREGTLCAQYGLLCSGRTRIEDSLAEGVSVVLFFLFQNVYCLNLNEIWKQVFLLFWAYFSLNAAYASCDCISWATANVSSLTTNSIFFSDDERCSSWKIASLNTSKNQKHVKLFGPFPSSIVILNSTFCFVDTWRRFPGW